MMKIGFFGDGPWSHKALDIILSDPDFEIVFICIRNDPGDDYLKDIAKKNEIHLLQHENINSQEFIREIIMLNTDIFVSLAFNQIFRSEIIRIPRLGIINCHAGKLPRYRGRNILNWALINDEKEYGITIHFVDEGIDTGDIILQKCFPISDKDSYKTLLNQAYNECGPLVLEALKNIKDDNYKRIKQDSISEAPFYCVGRGEGDEIIDWNQNSRDIFNFIRAISDPGPNATSFLNGIIFKAVSSEYIESAPIYKGKIGSIVGIEEDGFLVKTKDSHLKIREYMYTGKIRIGDRFNE